MKGTRMAVVTIGYVDYAMSMKDATTVLAIAQRAKPVVFTDRSSYRPASEEDGDRFAGELFAQRMEVATVTSAPRRIPKSHRLTFDG